MKITLPQLSTHLTKSLSTIYLVSGDETLLVEEALAAIRETAKKQGFNEHHRISVDSSDWAQSLYSSANSLSLFSEKRLLELNLTDMKLNTANTKLLQEFVNKPIPETILIIRIHKLDQKTYQTAWLQSIEKQGTVVQIWPVSQQQMTAWITQRAKKMGLQITARAADLLAQLCEGNLLAISQEIEKIFLLGPENIVDENLLMSFVTDNAHFDVYALVESLLLGNRARSLHILNHLRGEGIEPTLILWALTHELRLVNSIFRELEQGTTLSSLFSKYRVWEKRQGPIQQFIRKHKQEDCLKFLMRAAETDRIIKGAESGNLWNSLEVMLSL